MSGAARRRAREAARVKDRRRRTGWITAVAVVLALAGTVLGLHVSAGRAASTPSTPVAAVGQPAPDGTFTTVSGQQVSVASLRGKPTLLWFVATWCSSCEAGAKAMASNIDRFKALGVQVVTLELYQDLGQPGPPISRWGRYYAGSSFDTAYWRFGTASRQLTRSYDPKAYLDIYYLLDRHGTVAYVNGSPASTMGELLTKASRIA